MAALVTEASNASFKEHILLASRRGKREIDPVLNLDIKVSAKHFRGAFSKVRPSVTMKERKKYQEMKNLYSTSKSTDSMSAEQNVLSCDDDDEIGLDLIVSTDRERSQSQLEFDDDGTREDGNSIEHEFSTKNSVESDRIDTDDNEKERTTERLEDERVQVECDSSPSNPVVLGAPQVLDIESNQPPSLYRDDRLCNSSEIEKN